MQFTRYYNLIGCMAQDLELEPRKPGRSAQTYFSFPPLPTFARACAYEKSTAGSRDYNYMYMVYIVHVLKICLILYNYTCHAALPKCLLLCIIPSLAMYTSDSESLLNPQRFQARFCQGCASFGIRHSAFFLEVL